MRNFCSTFHQTNFCQKFDQKPGDCVAISLYRSARTKSGRYGIGQGQVSVEMLIGVIMVLFLFVVVQLFIEQTKQQATASQQNVLEQEVCTKLTTIITYMSSNPPYTETLFDLQLDTNVVNGRVFVGDIFCGFLGKAQNIQLYPGKVKAFDINGTVVFTNDLNYSPLNAPVGPPPVTTYLSGGIGLLIDDQNNTWTSEVQADDTAYATSPDDLGVDPDWVEFRFLPIGLTSANIITDVRFLVKHLESSQLGLGGYQNMVRCWNGSFWVDVNMYTPSFTELYYYSGNVVSCIGDSNLANNARFLMTYEPNGTGDTISIDYGRVDVNYLQIGSVIDLWENQNDLPQPVDFSTDINSLSNTFGPDAGNDGWDWNMLTYGGTVSAAYFNADPNLDGSIADSNVGSAKRLELKMGGGAPNAPADPDGSVTVGMVTSAAYGIQFDINSTHWSDIQAGSELLVSFTYTIDADAGWGNRLDASENGWLKARFGSAMGLTYLGSDLDTNSVEADATPEIWWADPPVDTSGFFLEDVSSLVTGEGTYYLDIGGGLSDWDIAKEGLGIYIDNVNVVVI